MGCCRYDLYRSSSGKVLTKMHNVWIKISEFTVTNNGSIRQNPYLPILQNWKLRIEYANKLAKKYLVGCHWIDFPEWTLSDEGHKWGPSALHYGKNYYNYAFSCTNEIIRRTDIEKNKGY